ncbi:unnamed protein product [Closterium sp. Naga37s-1]|nr:unnamed protein product [Closterium sp. Naga37s-1]
MAASGGLPLNPFNGVNGVNPLSDALRARPPAALSCSLSQGLSLSLLSSLSATWQHGKHRLRASASDASQPLEEPSQKKGQSGSLLERFPLKAAVTASGLALTGDTIAQLVERYRRRQAKEIEIEAASPCCRKRLRGVADKELWKHDFVQALRMASYGFLLYGLLMPGWLIRAFPFLPTHLALFPRASPLPHQLRGVADKELWQHDFIRALRMASYGFLLYGPGSYVWYQCLDRMLPAPTLTNFVLKVTANQVVLGPCVLLVVFAWNMAWMGKAKDIPDKYRRDFFPALVDGKL